MPAMTGSTIEDGIAVIGYSGRFPGAVDVDAFWHNLRTGVESVVELGEDELRRDPAARELLDRPGYVRAAAPLAGCDEFDAEFFGYTAREASLLDPQQRLFLEQAWNALEDAAQVPERIDGAIGVYAGVNLSTYLVSQLLAGRGMGDSGTALELILANDKDYVASRASYKLGLRGPAVAVQTACSSSLVAVHLAAQALLADECDLALAGGVALRFPQRVGYLHQPGLIFSADGHCRPFDAGASGTVAGNGGGVVVLKRLADAVADGDRVVAVILGSATNNDGSDKVGYTAPSIGGQATVVAAALGVAGVDPATVTAIEAHGTGTALGDPIEIAALTKVFGADRTGFCAVGSVKGNVGHLDSAAGVTGLIKALLQVEHGELAPSINFDEPNPEIDFDATPFYVNASARPWKANGSPRRIGVSSFGMGGTNAHVVLEEPPDRQQPRRRPSRPQVLVLSARTPQALDDATENLAGAIAGDIAGSDIADVAHTLQTGRRAFRHRRIVLADDSDVGAALAYRDPDLVLTHRAPADPPRLGWLFPGQGSQYPGMAADLYRTEPVFRHAVDEVLELFGGQLDVALRDAMLPATGVDPSRAADALRRTEAAQPALFTVEYALARLLTSWGVRPDAMIGHSVGEITAACVSGVLDLPDAVHLVATRARLMQRCEPGSMLAVELPEDELRRRLPDGLSVAAVNAPGLCVVAGPAPAVSAFATDLATAGVGSRALHTSHAFHSAMMDPMLPAFTAALAGVRFGAPGIPYVSNRTGTWATAGQVGDPDYWTGHVRDAVRFGDGVELLAGTGPTVLVEVGPGRTLGTLARQSVPGLTVLPALPAADDEDRSAARTVARTMGRLWLAGLPVDWDALRGTGAHRVRLPGYPFQRRRYWMEPASAAAPTAEFVVTDVADTADADADGTPAGMHPRPMLETEYVAPRTDVERRITAIWQDMLGVAPIGVFDNFIELGGHSLLAARLVERVSAGFKAEVALAELLTRPTIANMAELITGAPAESTVDEPDEDALPRATADPANLHEPFPLAEIQQAQWIGRMSGFDVGDIAAHVYWEVDLGNTDGGVDLDRLEDAWNRLMDRHQMLKAVILPDGRQRICPDVGPYRIAVEDLRAEPEEALHALRERLSHEVRPTETWPLFDIRASLLPDGVTRLHLGFELLLADIGSIRLLLRDWRAMYEGRDDELPPLDLSYRDYVLAAERIRRTPRYERSLEYWRDRVADLPPAPELPLARSAESIGRPEFVARRSIVPQERWDAFVAAATKAGVTPSAGILAAYATVLGSWVRGSRFTLNVTVTNRFEVHEHVDDLVGEFASFDLLPVDLAAAPTLAERARAVQNESWRDLQHRYVNGVEILRELARRRGGARGAAMPVVFTSTLTQQTEPGGESMFGWLGDLAYEVAQTPQVWMDAGVLPAEGGMQLSWHGVRDLFPAGLLDEMFAAFERLVAELSDPGAWDAPRTGLLPDSQAAQMDAVNATDGPVPDGFLTTGLAHWAATEPDRTAVVAADRTLTFGELYRHACAVAHTVRGLGIAPNQLVAVAVGKSCEQIVAAAGVLLAGAAYLPIDPDLPIDRQDHLIEHGRARAVLVPADAAAATRDWPVGLVQVVVDLDREVTASEPPEPVHTPDDLAYVVYTSGSTGQPKGVMLAHRAALNTLVDINERYGVGPDDRVLGLSSLSFDLSVWDVFGVLGAGGAVVLPEPGARRDPQRWLDLVTDHGVTLWNSVPALMQMFVDHVAGLPDRPSSIPIRLTMLSGDWIPVDLPDRLRAVVPDTRVISLGGATEAAVWSIAYPIEDVDPGWDSVPYGRPLRNQRMYVLNDRLEPCPFWATGELYIGGAGVAEGYWNDEERTRASFISHPRTGERLYRTGDLGRWLPGGVIEFLGREDFQVKVGGYRIELGEIESALLRDARVDACVAAAIGDRHHRRLVAYVVPVSGTGDEAFTERLRTELADVLPAYMVPQSFVVLDRLPLTANGKVDRAALPVPGATAARAVDGADPGEHVIRLAAIVGEVTGLPEINPHQNFFELGGDSITGVQIVSRATAEGLPVTLQDLFQATTLADLAAVLGDRVGDLSAGQAGEAVPVTPLQERVLSRPGTSVVRFAIECAEPDALTTALRALVERQPALRTRYRRDDDGAWCAEATTAAADWTEVPLIDLSTLPADLRPDALAEMVGELCDELDPAEGKLTGMALFDLGGDGRELVWWISAAAVDGLSWALLVREFFGLAARTGAGEPLPEPRPVPAFARWAAALPRPEGTEASTVDDGPVNRLPAEQERVRLDAATTATVLETLTTGYRMSLEQIALAVAGEALRRTGSGSVLHIEYDGRSAVAGEDHSGSVGAFAVRGEVTLAPVEGTVHDRLVATKQRWRPDPARDAVAALPARPDAVVRCVTGYAESVGALPDLARRSPAPWPCWLDGAPLGVTVLVFDDELVVDLVSHTGAGLAPLAAAVRDTLDEIVATCGQAGAGDISPDDFPLAGLDERQLASVLGDLYGEG